MRRPYLTLLLGITLAGAGCTSDLLLGLDADQGIEGLALKGPTCPVPSPDNPCPDAPYSGWIRIVDGSGGQVTRVRSGDDGVFRVGLKPGDYKAVGESGDPFPRGEEVDVTVEAGVWTSVTVYFDTGIR